MSAMLVHRCFFDGASSTIVQAYSPLNLHYFSYIHKLCFIATSYPVRLQVYLRKNNDYPQMGYLIFSIYRIGHLFSLLKQSDLNKFFSRSVTITQVLLTHS